jgi:DNA modification methylase
MAQSTKSELQEFIAKYAAPYDPEADTYRRPPFAQPVKAGKNSPIYNAHSYHTKVPPEGIVPYIEHYTDPGDLILDPFCGSGMTGVAALMTGRHAILNDLSPAAVHIARNYTTPVDTKALKREFNRIKAIVREEFDWLYGTTCDRCGGPATIRYTIWSDVFECTRCGEEIVLWDVAVDPDTGKVANRFLCPICSKEQTKKGLRRVSSLPIMTSYECPHCKPKRATHPTTEAEKQHIVEIEAQETPCWYPTNEFPLGRQTRKLREGTASISHVDQLYTKRNLRALARLWHEIGRSSECDLVSSLRFVFTSIAQRCSRLNRLRPSGAGDPMSGVLYVASLTREDNVLELLTRKFNEYFELAGREFHGTCITVVGSATDLQIPDSTVDYVFTDPPFGSNLQYAELNFLWEAWLQQFTDWSQDCVMNYVHKKDLTFYSDMMAQAFYEMYRVLKPGRWASVVFHNTNDAVWRAIQEGAQYAGFDVINAMAFDKRQGTFNQVNMGKDSAAGFDVILNLLKPKGGQGNGTASPSVKLDVFLIQAISDHLAHGPEPAYRTTQFLHSYAIRHLLESNVVIEKITIPYLEELLPHHFKLVDGRWYLRGEQVLEGGLGIVVKNEASAIAWLTRVLANEPQNTGDLIPQWQMATLNASDSISKQLDQILAENFWQDKRTGRWRIPTPTEREKMSSQADLSAQAHLRLVRRFLSGELDRRPDDRELAAWIRFCYSREFFGEAAQLFPHINEARLDSDEYKAIKRMATVSRLRAGQGRNGQ